MSKTVDKQGAFEIFKQITSEVESIRSGSVEPRTVIERSQGTGHFSVEVHSTSRHTARDSVKDV